MNDWRFLACLSAVLVAGCASERVVLLPDPDGRTGALLVRDAKGEILLNQPYAGTNRSGSGLAAYRSSPEEVKAQFGRTLSALPPRPASYTLYFETGRNRFTQESQAEFERIRRVIAERPASEVVVIGHTDRVGNLAANDQLSRQRAEAVRKLLIESGVAAEKLDVAGRGEREPLVQTADEVDEPKNRRVEISVR